MLQRAQLEGLKTGVLSLGFTLEIWGPQVITQALGASVSPWPPGTADPTSPSEVTRKDMVHQVTADPYGQWGCLSYQGTRGLAEDQLDV